MALLRWLGGADAAPPPSWAAAALADLVVALPLGIQHGVDTYAGCAGVALARGPRDAGARVWVERER